MLCYKIVCQFQLKLGCPREKIVLNFHSNSPSTNNFFTMNNLAEPIAYSAQSE